MGQHCILTNNGVRGACAGALVLMAHPAARIRITSPREVADALVDVAGALPAGCTVHVCGVGCAMAAGELRAAVSQAVAQGLRIVWYAGADGVEVRPLGRMKLAGFELLSRKGKGLLETMHGALKVAAGPGLARLMELDRVADDAASPKGSDLRRLRDLVLAANQHYCFFGDDTLNEAVMRHLAGLGPVTPPLETALRRYQSSDDATVPLGSSKAMRRLRELVGRIGPIDEPVLIHGPTGSGKEVVARALHVTSGRRGSFVAVNCAVLGGNPAVVEDRLFGHVRGAFTGADRTAKGAFDEAHEGTLFLDEIAELPPGVQSQLLRVLEEKRVRPLGTMQTHPVDVRIVAATHRDLRAMAAAGGFREDLYYRLDVLRIDVPPLSARPEDLRSIAAAECEALKVKGHPLHLTAADWQALRAHPWPGNVRELRNVLRRAAYLGTGVAQVLDEMKTAQDARNAPRTEPAATAAWPRCVAEVRPLETYCQAYVRHVVSLFNGNITRSARALGIAPNTVRKLKG